MKVKVSKKARQGFRGRRLEVCVRYELLVFPFDLETRDLTEEALANMEAQAQSTFECPASFLRMPRLQLRMDEWETCRDDFTSVCGRADAIAFKLVSRRRI